MSYTHRDGDIVPPVAGFGGWYRFRGTVAGEPLDDSVRVTAFYMHYFDREGKPRQADLKYGSVRGQWWGPL